MATFTGSRPWMVQGWRPTSATIQPHCPQTITSGMQARAALKNQFLFSSVSRQAKMSARSSIRAMSMPRPIIRRKAQNTTGTGGTTSSAFSRWP